jgi:hypothetical protein
MRMLRLSLVLLAIVLLLAASGCGRQTALLTADHGPGSYSGEFRDAQGNSLGTFDLTVEETGVLRGSGGLGTFTVDLRGVMTPNGEVAAFVTEEDSQRTGKFDGVLDGTALSGTWNLDPTGTQLLAGQWAAAPKP